MEIEEAKLLIGRYICVRMENGEEACGEILRVEREGEYHWLVFDWGLSVRLDAINEWWEEDSEC